MIVGLVFVAAAVILFNQARMTLRQSRTLDFLDRHSDGWRVRVGVWAEVTLGFGGAVALVVVGVLLMVGVIVLPVEAPGSPGTKPGQ